MADFSQQYLGQWPDNRGYLEVLRAWLNYFVGNENFDRQLPGAWLSPHCWMPHGCAINESRKHAQKNRIETIGLVKLIVIDHALRPDDAKAAEAEAAKMYHSERVELLERLERQLA